MRTLREFQLKNKSNTRLNINNIRKKSGKCGEYFTDEEINFIIEMFISKSKKLLTIRSIVDYMRYQILHTNHVKEIFANGYMEYDNQKYGNISHFKRFYKPLNRKEQLHYDGSENDIDSYDNKKYELKFNSEIGYDYWEEIK